MEEQLLKLECMRIAMTAVEDVGIDQALKMADKIYQWCLPTAKMDAAE